MNDRRLLACVVVLLLLVALVGSPAVCSARMFTRTDTIGEVDIDCMKGGEGSAGDDDDAWTNSGGGPPAETHDKAFDGDREFEEVRNVHEVSVAPVLPRGILFRILFARLFAL